MPVNILVRIILQLIYTALVAGVYFVDYEVLLAPVRHISLLKLTFEFGHADHFAGFQRWWRLPLSAGDGLTEHFIK